MFQNSVRFLCITRLQLIMWIISTTARGANIISQTSYIRMANYMERAWDWLADWTQLFLIDSIAIATYNTYTTVILLLFVRIHKSIGGKEWKKKIPISLTTSNDYFSQSSKAAILISCTHKACGYAITYTTKCSSTARQVITTTLYCKYHIYTPGQAE